MSQNVWATIMPFGPVTPAGPHFRHCICLSFYIYKYKNNRSSKNKCIEFSPKYKYYNISIMTGFKYCDAKKEKIPKG